MPRNFSLIGAAAAIALAATPAAAEAHTSATCSLSGGSVRCAGTIADRTVSTANTQGSLQVSGDKAELFLEAWPLVSIFTPGLPVSAELTCVQAVILINCSGTGQADEQPILVHSTGAGDGSSALITLGDAPATRDPEPAPQAHPAARHHTSSHFRRARRHDRRHHHRPRHHRAASRPQTRRHKNA
jgi:hypothetical protein